MEFKDGHTVGIDLGTTFSTLAYVNEDGQPVAVKNEDDSEETPSLIVLAESGHVLVGPSRSRAAMEDPSNVVQWIKREMGNVNYKRMFDGREITPEFLSALILKKLRQDAEKRIGKIGNAVITVPYYFNDMRRKATQDAGAIAGLNVVSIINEPTAATLTYAWHKGELGGGTTDNRPRHALVYDLGGGTFDVTVVKYTPANFRVLATNGDVFLGGVDWNERLADHIVTIFQDQHGVDLKESPLAMQMLRHECDEAKIRLSTESKTVVTIRFGGKAVSHTVTKEDFERLTADLLQRTIDTTELVLQEAKIGIKDLESLVVVGGSSLMPMVRNALFKLTGMKPFDKLNPYTAVAQGAAIHAAILEAQFRGEKSELAEKVRKILKNVKQEDVNSHGLGIVAKDPNSGNYVNHVMISRNSRLPVAVTQTFLTNHPSQQRVNVQVVEGDAPDPAACSIIGNCRIFDLPPNLPKGSPVEVTYSYDKSGRVRVSARDKVGGREASIDIERRGGLNQQQIDTYTTLAENYQVD